MITAPSSSRLAGLAPQAAQNVLAAMNVLRQQRAAEAEQLLLATLALTPDHPEALRLLAIALRLQGRNGEALQCIRQAAAQWPDDAMVQNGLGTALDASGDGDAAIAAFRRACELAPQVAELWANLGKTLDERGYFEAALPVLERALSLADHRTTRLRLAYCLRVLGRTDESAAEYRKLLARNGADAVAWLGLAGLKTRPFSAQDVDVMRGVLAHTALNDDDRISIGFALAKAEEDHARYADAFANLQQANALVRRMRPWNAAEFSTLVDEVLAAFAQPPAGAPNGQGEQVIFIVSMPRGGSSLTEQILASHPQIEGAGELDALTLVIGAESQRRGVPFPQWTHSASPQDWQRLGAEYLEQTRRWHGRARFTDKLPGNWLRVGAALAMLPGAHVIDCRRDALESSFSCYRQLFLEGAQPFSYDLDDVAAYWRDYDRSCRQWQALYPQHMRVQHFEALLEDLEGQVRQLLDFLGLPYDPACLRYTETKRSVRTASASQVREPLMRVPVRAAQYGALLDPLRRGLGLPPFAAR
jgi:tetratricopeptide (TPR) repeat protein